MFAEECPFKVVRTNGSDEVLARASNLLIGRAAFETARRMYPKDLISSLYMHDWVIAVRPLPRAQIVALWSPSTE
jgi:hypothetical protein